MLHVKHIKVEKEKNKNKGKEKRRKKYFPGNKNIRGNVTRETYESGKRKK